ncbi:MAG: SDR family oxidoreductase [Gemmatimonadota bacterium]
MSQATNVKSEGRYAAVRRELRQQPKRWLVTGSAGFIGSNLVETLLRLNQEVVGVDNFATGHPRNVEEALRAAGGRASNFRLLEGDVCDLGLCREACEQVDYVLHQAALGSVPRSIDDPLSTHRANVDGLINMLVAARDAGVKRFVYATSSSVYGDDSSPRKTEERTGRPLSPYAASKRAGEIYAKVFQRTYGLETIGLRYFGVFGPRQDPDGPYAAVIPRWIMGLLAGEECYIFGDGETSRDFCYIDNCVQANLLAATAERSATDSVYNVACGASTTLNELFGMIRDGLSRYEPRVAGARPAYGDFRLGDVRHSRADIEKIRAQLGYLPTHSVQEGLEEALSWYCENLASVPV